MARVLILYASVGSGHRSAANALAEVFTAQQHEVRVEDALDHGSSFYRQLYVDTYLELSEKAPAIWEYFYKLADEDDAKLVKDLRIFIDRLGVTDLDKLVESYQPTYIVCTHFLPLHIFARYKRKGTLSLPVYAVVTDYTGHVYWVYPEVDHYFVASQKTKEMLEHRGVSPQRLTVTGIPINPNIANPKEPAPLQASFGIEQTPVVTLIGSAVSVERVEHMVQGLQQAMRGTLVVVAGRNHELQQTLQKREGKQQDGGCEVRVLGFVENLDDLIAASDIVITKAGGLIVSEVMARHTPMVIIEPIPGQEEWNADYVVSTGAGVQVRLAEMVPTVVRGLLDTPERLRLMRTCAEQSGRPNAARTIVEDLQTFQPYYSSHSSTDEHTSSQEAT
jgi:processive 1,2-diacylglycerol beta-glucosyltransferase